MGNNLAKIHVKVVTGEEFTISNGFYGTKGPMNQRRDAEVQLQFLLTKMEFVTTDDGMALKAPNIVYAWVTD